MSERFYLPVSLETPAVELTGAEAHHLKDVLRLEVGDRVVLFDGRGTEAQARIASIGKRAVSLEVLDVRSVPAVAPPVALATAIPKGDRFRFLVEKAAELGVSRLVPLATERSVVHPRDFKLDKMRQTVIAATKQSGRAHLMQIDALLSWKDFLASIPPEHCLLVADPLGLPLPDAVLQAPRRPTIAVVGPEGGLTRDEIQAAVDAGALRVGLGDHVLRIETAAIALCTLLLLPRAAS